MDNVTDNSGDKRFTPYLSGIGAWALAFGCSVGWGAFVMPGNTFLPIAGPLGTALGIGIGAIVMMILGANYHFLMNRFSGTGGVYTYTKNCFGYDHGFVSAWFLIITYIAIIWANASALPLIARTLLGGTFQFGFEYEVAGFQVYFGEILLAVGALILAAVLCLRKKLAEGTQILMAVILFAGIVICFGAAAGDAPAGDAAFNPHYSGQTSPLSGIITIFSLAPWAFVGFESISHSTAEAKFSKKHAFRILIIAVITAAAAYILLALLATTALPEGCKSWIDYLANLDKYSGVASQPTFFSADAALGGTGRLLLGAAALGGIFTGLIGNYIALSRLLIAMSGDDMLKGWIGKLNKYNVPRNAILIILAISAVLPFFGRTAISWIVDVTTVGATIAYAYASASAIKAAREEKNTKFFVTGVIGFIAAFMFALVFLIPNLLSVSTLSMQSYFILAAWGILGLLYFRYVFKKDKEKRYGRSVIVWVVLLALIIFASSVWGTQETDEAINSAIEPIETHYMELFEKGETGEATPGPGFLEQTLQKAENSQIRSSILQLVLILSALFILFDIYRRILKREKQIELEKFLAEESSQAKTSFLSNMSHEIRTPMNAIIGLDNIALRNPDLQPQTREQLEKIGASAKHLLGLINDILDMSRIESGRMVLKNEEFSFREFLDQINIIINGQCVDKGLQYHCNIVGHIGDYYFGDDMKVKQVLINILGNSVKFTEAPGDVTLTVEEVAEEDGVCTMRFTMEDTGIGMDADYIPTIFDAFSQEDSTSTNKYGGSGLGMAITKNFVEMMNGHIDVQSEKGVGSVFTVTIDLGHSDKVMQVESGVYIPEGLRAVVCDDDEIACQHGSLVLKSIGIESVTFTNAKEALEELRKACDKGEPYDLLLTDYKMPVMNGLELTQKLREFDGGETAVILLTGYNWDIIEDEAHEGGVEGMLAKPLFQDNLKRKIHAILTEKHGLETTDVQPEVEESEQPEGILAGRRVLMAEDVEQNAEILEDLLDLEDIESEHAVNGQVAVDMFSESEPGYYDAILMDVRMPVMDGLTATSTIRALDRPDAKTIPIIAMTANVFDEDVKNSLEAGMNVHLSKPVEPEKLYETLARLLAESAEETEG